MPRLYAYIPQCEAYISFWNLEWDMVRQKLHLFEAVRTCFDHTLAPIMSVGMYAILIASW